MTEKLREIALASNRAFDKAVPGKTTGQCIPRAGMTALALAAAGISSELRVGVASLTTDKRAIRIGDRRSLPGLFHTWVELDDGTIIDTSVPYDIGAGSTDPIIFAGDVPDGLKTLRYEAATPRYHQGLSRARAFAFGAYPAANDALSDELGFDVTPIGDALDLRALRANADISTVAAYAPEFVDHLKAKTPPTKIAKSIRTGQSDFGPAIRAALCRAAVRLARETHRDVLAVVEAA